MPLKPEYALFKSTHGGRPGILQFTGQMKQAVSRPSRTATTRSLTLTIDSDVLPYHQEGTSRMSARPVVFSEPLPPEARRELDMAAEHYVSDFLHRLG